MRRVIAGLVVVLTTASVGWADTIVDDFNDGLLGTAWQVITQSEEHRGMSPAAHSMSVGILGRQANS